MRWLFNSGLVAGADKRMLLIYFLFLLILTRAALRSLGNMPRDDTRRLFGIKLIRPLNSDDFNEFAGRYCDLIHFHTHPRSNCSETNMCVGVIEIKFLYWGHHFDYYTKATIQLVSLLLVLLRESF